MNIRRYTPAITGALIAGVIGLAPVVTTTTAAVAAPASAAAQAGATPRHDDYRDGYRRGYRDGWRTAGEDCHYSYSSFSYRWHDRDRDWVRGYDDGFGRGYRSGFWEYCR
jgi:hypothetical protein